MVLALVTSGILALQHLRETPPVAASVQFSIPAPEGSQFGGPSGGGTGPATQLAVSPDGRHIVMVARTTGKYSLWLRSISTLTARPLPGTDDATFPFWSPDSRYVAFFAGEKLKKVQMVGGPPMIVCDARQGRGGAWNNDDVIVFGLIASPLQRVSSAGGTPVAAVQLDKDNLETSHRWPHFLPDGRHFLFTAVTGAAGAAPKPSAVKVGALDSIETVSLFEAESPVAYASGHLLFLRDGILLAQAFDLATRRLTGDSFPVAEQLSFEGSRYGAFSVSPTGTLVYAQGSVRTTNRRLVLFDRTGRRVESVGEPASYLSIALSRDERRVAMTVASGSPPNSDVWIMDVGRGISTRLTFDPASEAWPVWSPDNTRVVFSSRRAPEFGLRQKAVAGTSDDQLVLKGGSSNLQTPLATDWSPDGRFIAFQTPTFTSSATDIFILPLTGDRIPYAFAQGPRVDANAVFAPDGRWIAYTSDESGTPHVYVQPFPATGGRFQVSKDSGTQPLWRSDGGNCFF